MNKQEERQQFRYSGHSARNDAIMKFHGAGACSQAIRYRGCLEK